MSYISYSMLHTYTEMVPTRKKLETNTELVRIDLWFDDLFGLLAYLMKLVAQFFIHATSI